MKEGNMNEFGEIWHLYDNIFKAHCRDKSIAKVISSWQDCEESAIYLYPDRHIEIDVIFPGRLYNRVAELLKLPLRAKNPKRIAQGQRMSVTNKKHQFLRNTKSKRGDLRGFF